MSETDAESEPNGSAPPSEHTPRRAVGFVAEAFKHIHDKLQFDTDGNVYICKDGKPFSSAPYSPFILIVEEGDRVQVSAAPNRDELVRRSQALLDPSRDPYLNGRVSIVDFEPGRVEHMNRNATPTPPMPADTDTQQIHTAMAALHFALRFEESVRNGVVRGEMFGHAFGVPDVVRPYILPREEVTTEHMAAIAHNHVIHTKAAALVCADELLRKRTKEDRKQGTRFDDNHLNVVKVLKHIRDAHSHHSGGPAWKEPRKRGKRRPAPITADLGGDHTITLDMAHLAGKPVRPSHHGGLTGLMALLAFVERFVAAREVPAPAAATPSASPPAASPV